MHFSVGNSIKVMSRNSHFGCLLIPVARRCSAAATGIKPPRDASAAAKSKGKKGRSRNYYNYLVPVGKHPDFQTLLALA